MDTDTNNNSIHRRNDSLSRYLKNYTDFNRQGSKENRYVDRMFGGLSPVTTFSDKPSKDFINQRYARYVDETCDSGCTETPNESSDEDCSAAQPHLKVHRNSRYDGGHCSGSDVCGAEAIPAEQFSPERPISSRNRSEGWGVKANKQAGYEKAFVKERPHLISLGSSPTEGMNDFGGEENIYFNNSAFFLKANQQPKQKTRSASRVNVLDDVEHKQRESVLVTKPIKKEKKPSNDLFALLPELLAKAKAEYEERERVDSLTDDLLLETVSPENEDVPMPGQDSLSSLYLETEQPHAHDISGEEKKQEDEEPGEVPGEEPTSGPSYSEEDLRQQPAHPQNLAAEERDEKKQTPVEPKLKQRKSPTLDEIAGSLTRLMSEDEDGYIKQLHSNDFLAKYPGEDPVTSYPKSRFSSILKNFEDRDKMFEPIEPRNTYPGSYDDSDKAVYLLTQRGPQERWRPFCSKLKPLVPVTDFTVNSTVVLEGNQKAENARKEKGTSKPNLSEALKKDAVRKDIEKDKSCIMVRYFKKLFASEGAEQNKDPLRGGQKKPLAETGFLNMKRHAKKKAIVNGVEVDLPNWISPLEKTPQKMNLDSLSFFMRHKNADVLEKQDLPYTTESKAEEANEEGKGEEAPASTEVGDGNKPSDEEISEDKGQKKGGFFRMFRRDEDEEAKKPKEEDEDDEDAKLEKSGDETPQDKPTKHSKKSKKSSKSHDKGTDETEEESKEDETDDSESKKGKKSKQKKKRKKK